MLNKKLQELLDGLDNKPRSSTDSILLIDGLNTFLRSFTVINHINPDGHHIGGLTGALKSIGYAIRLINPTYVIVIFDGIASSSNKRNLFPEYKANRNKNRSTNYTIFSSKEEEDESVRNQIERLMHYLQCLPISLISIDGLEADDVIGFLVNKFENNDNTKKVTIMSADKDFLQLVSDKTQVYSPTKKKIYQPQNVLEEYEISSTNFIIHKILLGDKSDNIPGIVGLGPKKLIKLFPELQDDIKFTLKEVIEKSFKNMDDNKLYSSVCGFAHQLDINNRLMNLKEIFISNENAQLIKEMTQKKGKLDNYTFLLMYHRDNLGESIPNVSSWINDNFLYLENIT
jgi:DNA polymerase-1